MLMDKDQIEAGKIGEDILAKLEEIKLMLVTNKQNKYCFGIRKILKQAQTRIIASHGEMIRKYKDSKDEK